MKTLFDKIRKITEKGEMINGKEIFSIKNNIIFQNTEEVISLLNDIVVQNEEELLIEMLELDYDDLKIVISKLVDLVPNNGKGDDTDLQKKYISFFRNLSKNEKIADMLLQIGI